MKKLMALWMGLLFLSGTGFAMAEGDGHNNGWQGWKDGNHQQGDHGGDRGDKDHPHRTSTPTPTPLPVQQAVNLGSAANFVVLAATTITNSGLTTLCGDLGLSPGTAVTGAPVLTCGGVSHLADPAAAQAELDAATAYNTMAGLPGGTLIAGNLGGLTLAPGLYKSTSSLEISSGDLTLDAKGNPNAVFIFQIASTLTTTPGRQVVLSGGAQAANVFWQVGSMCSLDTTTAFKGTIIANTQITMNTGAVLVGRAFALTAQVTMLSNSITKP